jgi:anti-sigma regulatory factor (Ser/Thr protein kinase)
MNSLRHSFELGLPFDEFRVWSQRMLPLLAQAGVEQACLDVLEYVCTEMLNNVLDHSGAGEARVALDWNVNSVLVHIDDDGRGVFAGIREALALDSDADAAMLVLKGKVTTDPARHTGEGLFFSARVCEWFNLQSARTALSLEGGDAPWAYEALNETVCGTRLRFRVSRTAPPKLREVFDRFCPQPELRFTRTVVSVALMQQSDGAVVSRSQGKRLVLGLERFTAVTFDFTGVTEIQQGFADEVFRVWAAAHPDIDLNVLGATEAVTRSLRHVGFVA